MELNALNSKRSGSHGMKLLSVKEISALIQAKPSTIYQWAELGQIPCFKINGLLRFDEKGILDWLKNQKRVYNTGRAGRRPGKEVKANGPLQTKGLAALGDVLQ